MGSLEQLKKRLRSVRLSAQLATAMKTVSSAKYAKLNKLFSAYHVYAAELNRLVERCGWAGTPNREGGTCYVILGYNRGLCGGYNAELYAFAQKILNEEPNALRVVCGKRAVRFFEEKEIRADAVFSLPDVPRSEDCGGLCSYLQKGVERGEIGQIKLIYQSFVNTLTQKPAEKLFYPFAQTEAAADMLFLPSRDSVAAGLEEQLFVGLLYETVLEAAIGAQAATLVAMRNAANNAADTAERLEREVNQKRQSAVTAAVIETSAGALHESEE